MKSIRNLQSRQDIESILNSNGIFRKTPTTDIIVSSISPSLKHCLPIGNRNLNDTTEMIKNAFFNQKKVFADEVTKSMSNGFLFNDENQEVVANFQKLINNMFNEKISDYKRNKELDDDSIYFIYKGGTAMKMLFEKYKDESNYKNIMLQFNEYFERSDADYSIYINKKLGKEKYNQTLCDMNSITNHILTDIQQLLSANLETYCPINSVTPEQLTKLLQNCNDILDTKMDELPDISKEILKFIGIGFGNIQIFPQGVIGKLNEDQVHSFKQNDRLPEPSDIKSKKLKNFMTCGKIEVKTRDFIIKVDYQGEPEIPIPVICYLQRDLNPNGIYYYFNETNNFKRTETNITEFNLHRLKINTILYYITKTGQYGFLLCPSELVDVSITTFTDSKSTGLDFAKIIQQYDYNNEFSFYSYSLYGFIDDLMKGIFEEKNYPWEIGNKYIKKVQRLIVLLHIYICINFINVTEIYWDIKYRFQTQNFTSNIKLKQKEVEFDESILSNLYKNMDLILKKINTESDAVKKKELENQFIILIQYFINIWKFSPDANLDNSSKNAINVLNKYLKYKSKYLSLKKLMCK